jgi:hypothetical protein
MRFLCWFLPHKWRRPHKGEASQLANGAASRVCRRCGHERPVRARKAKA